MKRRIISIISFVTIFFGIIGVVIRYYFFVSQKIYAESTSHLTEVYHQANQSLRYLLNRNWNSLHLWVNYFNDVQDEDEIEDFINKAQKEVGFTDFYFIDRNSKTINHEGNIVNINLNNRLPELIIEGKDLLETSVMASQDILVFAVPAYAGTYRGHNYEAIAISFNNSDLVKALEISAFGGESSSYIIHSDGRVLIDNSNDYFDDIYNVISLFRTDTNLTDDEILSIRDDFKNGKSGSKILKYKNRSYYLIYEPGGYDDWIILGIVPTSVVNKSMNSIQTITLFIVSCIAIVLSISVVVVIIWKNRLKLKEKDVEIQYQEELFKNLSINVNDVFLMLDAETFKVDYISPNIEKMMGVKEEDAKANVYVINDLLQENEKTRVLDLLTTIEPNEQAEWDREYIHLITKELRWFHLVALCSIIQEQKKYILVMSDRTKERKINQELEDAVLTAQRANKAKSTFLNNMSHDIRTPMNAIIGFSTLAASNIENKEKVKDYLSKIISSGNHLLSLINDILDMSRIESGKIQLEEMEANLSDMLHDIKTIISGQINAKQLDLYMDVIDVVNEDVYCDKTRINQVLLNLLSNAIKFTPSGGTISVRIKQISSSKEGKGQYEIRVKDTGIGMSQDFVEKIFEPFERERTSTVSKIQGTGLGMAISKNIIDMMGGSIDVITELGKGTEFIIGLTLRLQNNNKESIRIEELDGLKALVVDDDFNTCDSVTKMLVQVGMRSEWTLSGKEAVLRARQSLEINDPFHAYIIDWRLPDINGIEVVRQIRGLGDLTPIIILTAYDWLDIEEEAKKAGVTAFCSKPMFMSDLRTTLLEAIGKEKKEDNINNIIDNQIFKGKKVLLVEDNELNLEIACELLEEHGFNVDTAIDGQIALTKIKNSNAFDYDLVLMDIQMPVMDGYTATREIRALDNKELANIPIIAMTANAFDEDKKAAFEAGMNGFLTKPINIDDVIQVIKTIFKNNE